MTEEDAMFGRAETKGKCCLEIVVIVTLEGSNILFEQATKMNHIHVVDRGTFFG
jgi:hypothetical protein